VAGQWVSKNGVPAAYCKNRHDAQPSAGAPIPQDLDEAALLNFSAEEFLDLASAGTNPLAYASGSGWTVQVHAANTGNPVEAVPRLLHARLVLSGADLHPTEEELVIGASNRQLEYRMRETSLQVFTKEASPPLVFARDPLPADATPEPETSASNSAESGLPAHSAPRAKPPVNVSLEVDVLSRLPFANLVLGRQARLERRPDGGLELLIAAGSDQEKNRIVKDLGPMPGEPQLVLRFETPTEFGRDAGPAIDADGVNVLPEVRTWVAGKLAREGLTTGETEVVRRARAEVLAILENAERMQAHNRALREAASRFDQKQIDSLDAERTSRWLAVWSQYLSALQIEATSLLKRLTPIFGGGEAVSNVNSPEVTGDNVFSALWEVTGDLGRIDLSLDQAMLSARPGAPGPPMQNVCQQLQAAIARLSAVRTAVDR